MGPCRHVSVSCVLLLHVVLLPGNYFTYQLMLATTDLLLHSTFDPNGPKTASDIQQQQYAKIMVRGPGRAAYKGCKSKPTSRQYPWAADCQSGQKQHRMMPKEPLRLLVCLPHAASAGRQCAVIVTHGPPG